MRAYVQEIDTMNSRLEKVMNNVGFSAEDAARPVKAFSGGWKMRIGLAKILLKDPNILLLDEPTNHLDIDSVEWLESFLRNQNIPMVIVSHDREFLDRVCNKIVDVEEGKTYTYEANYSTLVLHACEWLILTSRVCAQLPEAEGGKDGDLAAAVREPTASHQG
jgi:ATPase subunit of ABC transporter with duplicated ATPase domains